MKIEFTIIADGEEKNRLSVESEEKRFSVLCIAQGHLYKAFGELCIDLIKTQVDANKSVRNSGRD